MDESTFKYTRVYAFDPDYSDDRGIAEQLQAAEYISQDSDSRIFHRFDELRLFVLLRLQHRLVYLANRLKMLSSEQDQRMEMGANDGEKDAMLDQLVVEVGRVLKAYDDTFAAQARLEHLHSPPEECRAGLVRYCAIHHPALSTDLGSIPNELVFTAAREKSPVHHFIDKYNFLTRYFAKKSERSSHSDKSEKSEESEKSDKSDMFIYSESSIRKLERVIVHVGFCLLLLCPIIALSLVGSTAIKLAIVLMFLLGGAFLTSGILTVENNAGLAVLAGYGAILVFFLGVKVDFS